MFSRQIVEAALIEATSERGEEPLLLEPYVRSGKPIEMVDRFDGPCAVAIEERLSQGLQRFDQSAMFLPKPLR